MNTTDSAKPDGKLFGTDQTRYSVYDLAEILDVTRRAVLKRSQREEWPVAAEVEVQKGIRRLYEVTSLPADIQARILAHHGQIPESLAECLPAGDHNIDLAECAKAWEAATEKQRIGAKARVAILEACDRFLGGWNGNKRTGHAEFCRRCCAGEIELEAWVSEAVPKFGRTQIYEWRSRYEQQGPAGLLDCRGGHNRGQSSIPPEQRRLILGIVANHPHLRPDAIRDSLSVRFNGSAVPERKIRRFVSQWRRDNPALATYVEDPDAYKSHYQFAIGNQSEKAERFLHWVEVDSTPADVICSDGLRHTIIGLIDVFSRKVRFVVSHSSNSWAIAWLVRRTCLDWGIPENLIRDNGQDYVAQRVNGILESMGIQVHGTLPFAPEEKPHIERIFGTMTRDLAERLPGYCGHSVTDRQAIENRKSFAQRLMKRSEGRQEAVEIGISADELRGHLDWWTKDRYHQRKHSILGRSPNAQASLAPQRRRRIENPRELDILFAVPDGTATRKIGKKGLRFENGLFWGNEFIGRAGDTVAIRYDLADAGRLYCFEPDSREFICIAEDMALSGITVDEKIRAKRASDKIIRQQANALRALGKHVDPLSDARKLAQQRTGTVANLPTGDPADLPALRGVRDAIRLEEEREAEAQQQSQRALETAFAQQQYRLDRDAAQEADPKIVRFPERQSLGIPSDHNPDRDWWEDPLDRFDWLRVEQRRRALAEKEINWLQRTLNDWQDYALSFRKTWPERDQRWLQELDPDVFDVAMEGSI